MKDSILTALRLLFVPTLFLSFWLAAGRWDLPFGWAYWGLWIGWCLIAIVLLAVSKDFRALARERGRVGPGAVEENLPALIGVSLLVVECHWVIAGLDVGRYH